MTFEDYRQLDALDLVKLVKQKSVNPSELLEIAIKRAETVNPSINAIVHPLYDLAKRMIEEVNYESPFAGLPLLVKDLGIQIQNTPMRLGCKGLKDYVSSQDSVVGERLRKAGFLFMGKTNTPELGLTPYTEPELFGASRNPWNLAHTPGGSSGGSAAAVAAGIVPIATASDGGGSIRIPASSCGLFGIKPSRGRISLGYDTGEMWGGAVVEGCVSRSVRDSAAYLDALQGDAIGELHITQAPRRPYLMEVKQNPSPLKIAYATEHTLGLKVDAECISAVEHTIKLLERLGHQVERVALPFVKEDLTRVFLMMVFGEVAATLEEISLLLKRKVRPADVEANTWALGILGHAYSAKDYALRKRQWNNLARRMGQFHQEYDLLLTPTLARPPVKIGELEPTKSEQRLINFVNTLNLSSILKQSVDQLAERIFEYIPYTPIANMTGQPSMSVPLYWTPDQLPVGVMFTAEIGREDILFQLAGQLEKTQPWFAKTPDL